MAPRSEFKECLTSAWNSIFIPLVQELWPSLTFTLPHKSAMKPRDLELFSCFTTLALHREPPGRRSPAPSIGRPRIPTGTATSQHARLGAQLGRCLGEAGQVGGGQAEAFGVHRSCGKTGVGCPEFLSVTPTDTRQFSCKKGSLGTCQTSSFLMTFTILKTPTICSL